MKTLVNKNNPAIRITAPDGMVKNRTNCWAIWSEGDRLMLLDKENWTLVEGEQEQSEVDLEKEIEKKWNECDSIDEGMGAEYANIVIEQFDEICKYFYDLGLNARKEE